MHRETQIECEFKWRIWSGYKAVDMSLDFSRRLQEPCIDLIDYQWLKTLLENYDSHREINVNSKVNQGFKWNSTVCENWQGIKKKTKKKRAVLINCWSKCVYNSNLCMNIKAIWSADFYCPAKLSNTSQGLKKTWIAACPLACPGLLLACLS